jgi:endogenous inhibitor of DNA gyrase (YacG/DUF329 family)
MPTIECQNTSCRKPAQSGRRHCSDACQQAARNTRQRVRRNHRSPKPPRAYCADCEIEFPIVFGNGHEECDWYQLGPAVRSCRHCGKSLTTDNVDPWCSDRCFIDHTAPDLGLDPRATTIDDIMNHPGYDPGFAIPVSDSSGIFADGEDAWSTPGRLRDRDLFKPTKPARADLKVIGQGADTPPPPGYKSWDDV